MGIDTSNLKGDLFGGFIAAIIALPLALAFGVQSGLGAEAGLYGAIMVGIFAAMFGGTPTQASGPTGPMTVVAASIVAFAIDVAGSIEKGLGIVLLSFAFAGAIQIVLGLLGVGKYIRYFPYPVISGFMSGVGIIIIALQLWPLLGSSSPKSVLKVFTHINEPISALNVAALSVGLLTLVVNYVFPMVTKKVPSVLVALLTGTIVANVLDLDIPQIGDLPSGLPSLRISEILSVPTEHYAIIFKFGLTLAILGSIDSLLTSVIADNVTKTRHNSRMELIGQGIGNLIAAAFGGIPGAGATKGTVVAINAGAKTRIAGVSHGVFQLIALLGAGSLVAKIPLSVLAGLLISVGVAIIDYKGIRHVKYVPRADSAVMVIVLIWTVFGNLIHAVAIGVVLASILFMKTMSDLAEAGTKVGKLEREEPWGDEASLPHVESIYIKHLDGPLFFGFSAQFRDIAEALPKETSVLVIRMERVPYIDQSGLYTLEEAVLSLTQRGRKVAFTGLQFQVDDMLRRINLIPDLVSPEQVFEDFAECREWLRGHIEAAKTEAGI